jgi:hypothetical protein
MNNQHVWYTAMISVIFVQIFLFYTVEKSGKYVSLFGMMKLQ